jgi:hypothetical protein
MPNGPGVSRVSEFTTALQRKARPIPRARCGRFWEVFLPSGHTSRKNALANKMSLFCILNLKTACPHLMRSGQKKTVSRKGFFARMHPTVPQRIPSV